MSRTNQPGLWGDIKKAKLAVWIGNESKGGAFPVSDFLGNDSRCEGESEDEDEWPFNPFVCPISQPSPPICQNGFRYQ